MRSLRTASVAGLVAFLVLAGLRASGAAAPLTDFQTPKNVEQISEDTLPPQGSSQPDTQTEPDIAVDPNDPQVVVATFQQGRYADGGSVDPGYATSHDGGATWIDGNLPRLTTAVGGSFERASDPAVAIGPDGAMYISTLPFDTSDCRNGVAVQRSDDAGITFGKPIVLQLDTSCEVFNDKEWVTVDTYPSSPHYGRVYVAWDRATSSGQPIVLRYSDDRGGTWSALKTVGGGGGSVGAQPVVRPNGDLTIVYEFSGGSRDQVVSQTSRDGGETFGLVSVVGVLNGGEPPDMRTGRLPSAAVDPVTGSLYAVWQDKRFHADGLDDIVISSSSNGGRTWTGPARVNQDPVTDGVDHFTPDVAAYGGYVHVAYRTRATVDGVFVGKVLDRYIVSADGGLTFGGELILGQASKLRWAAQAGGRFYGDYMGVAATAGAAHAVWCVSSRPATPEQYHQTTWTATILK
jgi:hypothetical protein